MLPAEGTSLPMMILTPCISDNTLTSHQEEARATIFVAAPSEGVANIHADNLAEAMD